ncbi:MAG: phytoene desaturase family protein [Solirubrobacterales bacterium]
MTGIAARLEIGLPEPVAGLAARDWDAIVVGGGHNGLTAAAYLARAGRRVLVCERRERLGGACTLEEPFGRGWEMSPCAYVVGLLDALVIDELGLRRRGVEIRVGDPELYIPFEDGTAFVQFLDEERTAAALRGAGFGERDVRGLRDYNELFDRIRRLLRNGERDAWVGDSPSRAEVEELLGGERELVDVVFTASIADVLDDHFADERIKRALYPQGLIAAWGGPRTPGTASIHLMHHMGEIDGHPGSWGYVRGGMGAISLAIADAAREAGAVLACEVPVGAIIPDEGVELEDGTAIRAGTVLCNADPKVALHLLDGQDVPEAYERRLREWSVRSPALKLNARVGELPRLTAAGGETWPMLGTVDCVEPLEAAEQAFAACERGEVRIAYAELYSQTAADPTPAPGGGHLISAFCQYGPFEPAAGGWDSPLDGDGRTVREDAARQVFELIERFAPGFEASVEAYELFAPPDIEQRIGLAGGQIFQGECFPDQMWDRRLSAHTPVDGLYLCGAATHPGGSVIGLNGRNAAMAALAIG